jgi:starch synthase (maltosyl-transferring)
MAHETRPHPAHATALPSLENPRGRFFIEDIYPVVDGGRFAAKRIAGEPFEVWADIFRDGHDVVAAALLWRRSGDTEWQREPMRLFDNDRWRGSFVPPVPDRYFFAIEAWTDAFATWRRDYRLKQAAGADLGLELLEGCALLARARGVGGARTRAIRAATQAYERLRDVEVLLADDLAAAMTHAEPRADLTTSVEFALVADRPLARAGAWYEMFPRSQSGVAGRHGTFADCIGRLPEIAALGFDVLYLPPIHPIGRKNRKGKNNALRATAADPGSPYAIGGPEGGHDAIHPELGTLDDFRVLVAAACEHGLEIALDFAIQCSPDHPWLREHPGWFAWRPDGSLRYAENPPKKYEDIVNPDFYAPEAPALWIALRDVVLFWLEQGVRIFRVDNPHTKPLPFWEWLIGEVKGRDPGVVFLAEAFTRPKLMKALAKLGFSQSYTYFTWRTGKAELTQYLQELTRHPERDYLRPNFFVNTPDILPLHLQGGEPWMFKSRLALAATLAGSYGVYEGFELLEHLPVAGKEEYLNSEKYEIKTRDHDAPGNIKSYMAALNRLRRENRALMQTADLRFLAMDDDEVIGFVKESPNRDNAVAVAIALAGGRARTFWMHFGHFEIGPEGARRPVRAVEDLRTGERRALEWGGLRLTIDPADDPALLFRCLA